MTVRNLELEFTSTGLVLPVVMHWEDAPQTCAAIWDMLEKPLVTNSHHAVFSGYEFFLYCEARDIELENHVVYPKPGQLLYYFLPARRNSDNVAHKINLGGHKEDAAEIAIWYGEGDLRRMTECGVRGNHFATVHENLDGMFRAGHDTLVNGETTVALRRSL